MNVQFPGPAVPMQDGGISYRATVDGVTVACQFTWEALQDVNPEFTLDQPINQFNFSAERLLAIAEKKIRNGGIVNGVVLVNTGDL
ncbi:DUF1488 family protein [Methyloversatilis universalis]|uniref:DUF1488 family protein n=1 Tax=Methyloversatilis universalis TaxID=378211 RepID=UPI0005BD4A4A|nr:DUF1488 family protein [Methyloversatilis universalis]